MALTITSSRPANPHGFCAWLRYYCASTVLRLGFIGFLGFRAGSHPQLAYLSLFSFASFRAFYPTLEVSKIKLVLHPRRTWLCLSLLSLFALFFLFTTNPDLSGLAFISFTVFFTICLLKFIHFPL